MSTDFSNAFFVSSNDAFEDVCFGEFNESREFLGAKESISARIDVIITRA